MSAERRRPWRLAVGLIALLELWSSVWIIGRDEQGVVTRFGRVDRVLTSGMQFSAPWPFERVMLVATTAVRTITIGGRNRPFDPVGRGDNEWLTGDTNLLELAVDAQYVIDRPEDYLFALGAEDDPARDATIAQLVRAELTSHLARLRIDDALSAGKVVLQREVHDAAQRALDGLGIGVRLLAVQVRGARPPVEVIAAFNDVTSAESDRERMLSEADGDRRDLLPRERSRANSLVQAARIEKSERVSRARGSAARFGAIHAQARNHPELTRRRLWLDAVEALLEAGETVVYPAREGEIFALRVVED